MEVIAWTGFWVIVLGLALLWITFRLDDRVGWNSTSAEERWIMAGIVAGVACLVLGFGLIVAQGIVGHL